MEYSKRRFERLFKDSYRHPGSPQFIPHQSKPALKHKSGSNETRANTCFKTHDIDLLPTIAFRDDSQPLSVSLGNTGLKTRQTSTVALDYANHNGPNKQELSLGTSLDYSRRGYGSSELNTDDFLLNASLSQPFLKGKLIARIEAFDLLQQLSSTRYEVNAQGRTET